jgi:putative ABC transport system substrate-binding protein
VKRRTFIAGLGGVAALPLAARAQQAAMPVIGFLRSTPLTPFQRLVTAFGQGLKEAGFVDGQNVAITYRYADNQVGRLPALVAELIRLRAAVIVVNVPAAHAAKEATTTVPIVFASGNDPVQAGLVASLNRPGGNVTGVTWIGNVGEKRLELLHQVVPKATTIGMLVGPSDPGTEAERRDVHDAAQLLGRQLIVLDARSDREIETAFATLIERGAGALLLGTGAFLTSYRERLAALATRHALPSISTPEFALADGLMGYGTSQGDAYRQAGIYAGRILKGEKPNDLPIMRSAKFELVINLKTAKALGLTIPETLLATADEVIQ